MKEKSMQDFLMEHLDWLSVTNYQVSFDELLIDLDKQGIAFDEKETLIIGIVLFIKILIQNLLITW